MPVDRYHRQTLLPEFGREGQARLARSCVAVVGVGALGSASSEMLARAGVGHLILIDRDIVEPTNLQRQTLYTEADANAGVAKARAARDRLKQVNSTIEIEAHAADLSPENIEELLEPADVVVDGTDNFETRYLLNDYAIDAETPLVLGGGIATRGTVLPIIPERGPCLRCLHDTLPEQTETCDTAGVLGPIVAMIGARQAAVAMRLLIEGTEALPVQLESYDAWTGQSRSIDLADARDPNCICCGKGNHEFLDGKGVGRTVKLCGRNAVQITPANVGRIDLLAVTDRLKLAGSVTALDGMIRAIISDQADDAFELTVFSDGRAIVKGTEEPARARSIYARYVGG
ncbi:MAG: ThiF family adenylyltransferase [Phycisphaerales bacterium JB061]